MSDEFDPLEQELRRLRPRALSLETEVRIEDRLAEQTRRQTRYLIAAGIAFGISIGTIWTLHRLMAELRKQPQEAIPPIVLVPPGLPVPAAHDASPTLAAYRQAFATSPEALEALLRKPLAGGRAKSPVRWGQSLRFDAESPF